jgi:hypothetical protein
MSAGVCPNGRAFRALIDTAGTGDGQGARILKPRKAAMAEAQFAISFDERIVTA